MHVQVLNLSAYLQEDSRNKYSYGIMYVCVW